MFYLKNVIGFFYNVIISIMGKYLFLILIFCINTIYSYSQNVVDLVNPLIGTAIKGEGGTVPFVGPPFAMTNFLPQTRENKMGSMAYVYDDESIIDVYKRQVGVG